VTLQARISKEGKLDEIRFTGQGCAISQASASLLTVKTRGKNVEEALALERAVHDLITTGIASDAGLELGDLRALGGVSKFPQRVKCAALAWNALREILGDAPSASTTSDPSA
jgi:nitrogen fixation NifU-like protein